MIRCCLQLTYALQRCWSKILESLHFLLQHWYQFIAKTGALLTSQERRYATCVLNDYYWKFCYSLQDIWTEAMSQPSNHNFTNSSDNTLIKFCYSSSMNRNQTDVYWLSESIKLIYIFTSFTSTLLWDKSLNLHISYTTTIVVQHFGPDIFVSWRT